MARRNESIFELLIDFPWWVSVLFAVVVFSLLTWLIPSIQFESTLVVAMAQQAPNLAWIFSGLFLLSALLAFVRQWRQKKLLDSQKDIESIKSLSWQAFEGLLAEYYRRQGYSVAENHGAGADGGVDLRLTKDGQRHLVQCKQWRSQKVGVPVVREMFGVLMAEQAASMTIITSGHFTQEAKLFAQGKAIELIDGSTLVPLIQSVQKAPENSEQQPTPAVEVIDLTPTNRLSCPRCGSELVARTASRGANAGQRFYGCSAFPSCRFTKPWESSV